MEKQEKRQFIVLGLGRFGSSVALTLQDMGHMVMGIDRDEAVVQSMSSVLTHVMQLDICDTDALAELDVSRFDAAVVAVRDLESSLMCTMFCHEAGVQEILVKANTERHGKMAEKLGASQIIFSERDTGRRVARRLAFTDALDYVELDESIHLARIKAPRSFLGKSLVEIDLRGKYQLNVIAVRNQGHVTLPPDPRHVFTEDDQIVLIGRMECIEKFKQE